jgi:UDP-2,3-diacylglucosamine hydrolase
LNALSAWRRTDPLTAVAVSVLFVSDIHLDADRPDITRQFVDFLRERAASADALYILGDLFESWIGDDAADAGQCEVTAALAALAARGTACFVMHGNRDFLLGSEFCRLSGAQLLVDPTIVTLFGERVLITHGDALCSDDVSYQRLRGTVRDADWQRRFLALTRAERAILASAARDGSRAHTADMHYEITDVNAASVAALIRAAGVAILLHGHTHRPDVHRFAVDGRACTRIVLGDWHNNGHVLEWSFAGYRQESLPRNVAPEI